MYNLEMPGLNKSRRRQSRRRQSRRRQHGGASQYEMQQAWLKTPEGIKTQQARDAAWKKWQAKMASADPNRKGRGRGEPCSSMLGWDNCKKPLFCGEFKINATGEGEKERRVCGSDKDPDMLDPRYFDDDDEEEEEEEE